MTVSALLNRPAGLPTMGQEIVDFLRFVVHPKPGPRLGAHRLGPGVRVDFSLNAPLWRLVHWAVLLWMVNIFVFAPLALSAAEASGAQHRLDIHNLPWLTALIWAPIVEELTFRFALRRPVMLLWFVPIMAMIMVQGVGPVPILLAGVALLLALAPQWYPAGYRWQAAWVTPWRWRRRVRRLYPLLFHVVALTFAAVHLYNFRHTSINLVLMSLLVLPQWVTGLVLGWIRVKRGIGASMALHAIFNGGPLLLIGLVLHFAPQLAAY
ncbi:type II CAAX prenyl endopeptidase Rce1 family protein [Castellaniella sp.]|uniref:CPBP family glutamic-type intramembrane protease n=1 Tax=Castellaniella sp. TaxID=1955812 RepID=UPI002B00299D|nr:CPBP family glutamic-type intramembrane protease [Castellaniella sp.]